VADAPATPATPSPSSLLDQIWTKIGPPLTPSCIHVAALYRVGQNHPERPATVEELAQDAGLDPRLLRGIVHTLAAEGFFREAPPGRFQLTALGRQLGDEETRNRILDRFEVELPYFLAMDRAVRGRQPAFELVYRQRFYDYLAGHPRFSTGFNAVLSRGARRVVDSLVPMIPFDRFHAVLDVGGGEGELLLGILARFPQLSGALLEHPAVAARLEEASVPAKLKRRYRVIAGDFFQELPTGYDLILLRWVLCDWEDSGCLAILQNCRRALAPGGRIVIVEPLRDDAKVEPQLRQLDFHLRLAMRGGLRTLAEQQTLLRDSQLEWIETRPSRYAYQVTLTAPSPVDRFDAMARTTQA
jgi:SAM-dependent methyltransferase